MRRLRFRATQEGRTNICLQSETFQTTWSTSQVTLTANQTAAPNGTTTADLMTEDGLAGAHGLGQTISAATNVPYATSLFYKPNGRTWVRLFVDDGGGTNAVACYFNCSGNGTVGTTTNGGTGSSAAGSIIPLANGWYRVILTGTPASASTGSVRFLIRMTTADNTSTYTGDGTSGGYVWGAQMEAGRFATNYIATTTTSLSRGSVGR